MLDIPTEPSSLPYDTSFSLSSSSWLSSFGFRIIRGLVVLGSSYHLLGFSTFLFTIGAGYTQKMSIMFFQSSYLNFSRLIGWLFLLLFVIVMY